MYLIIIGAGRIGERIIELATGDEHEVVVIEKNTDRAEEVSASFDCLVLNADATSSDVLEQAGIKKADALLTTTNDDATNLLIMMVARRYQVPRLLSSVREPDHIALFDELDIDFVESPHRLNGEYLYRSVQRPGIKDFMKLNGGAEIVEIQVGQNSPLIDKTIIRAIEEQYISRDIIIVSIYREGEIIIPKGDSHFEAGDIVTLLSKESFRTDMIEKFIQ